MVDVTFLGTGGAFSAGRRSNLALLIEASDFRMLVEAGPPLMQQLARIHLPPARIEHVFVSHAHGDHTLGFPMLALSQCEVPSSLHVYAGPSTIATLEHLCTLAYPDVAPRCFNLHWHALSEDGPGEKDLGVNIVLHTIAVPHPPGIPTLAARWDLDGLSVTFATDTCPCAATAELARGSDILIHEAFYSATLQPDINPAAYCHSTAQQAGEIARQAGCPRLALVHLGQEIGEHPDLLAEEARAGTDLDVIVPEDGERIHLGDR